MRFSLNIQAEALGHDLSFGNAAYRRPDRGEDAPDIEPDTGEAVPSPRAAPAAEGTGEDAAWGLDPRTGEAVPPPGAAPAAESTGDDAAEGRDPPTGEEPSAEESLAPSF